MITFSEEDILPTTQKETTYKLIKKIGMGGFGEVFEAIKQDDDTKVAIKIFKKDNGTSIKDWINEANQGSVLGGENVIKTLDFQNIKINNEEISYLVMEYADGGNLRDVINDYKNENSNNFIPNPKLIDYFKQILKGLEEIHKNILHRDIKPENFLFSSNTLKISDFGLAKFIDESTRSKTYKGWGTYFYMAPESWRLGQMTAATDIYSIGIMFYELITLQLPFIGTNPIELENQHYFGQIPNPKTINSNLPNGFYGIIQKSMQKNPKDRYQTATEMLKDIESIEIQKLEETADLNEAVQLATEILDEDQLRKNLQLEEEDSKKKIYAKCMYKIGEFINQVQEVVDIFNQNIPQEKIILIKGSETDYTIFWKNKDLITFRFNPYIFSENLKIDGNNLFAYGYAEFADGKKDEGINFILIDITEESYGEWKILNVSGNPLAGRLTHPVAVELEIIRRIAKLGNTMDVIQHQTRSIESFKTEISEIVKKALTYYKEPQNKNKEEEDFNNEFGDGFY